MLLLTADQSKAVVVHRGYNFLVASLEFEKSCETRLRHASTNKCRMPAQGWSTSLSWNDGAWRKKFLLRNFTTKCAVSKSLCSLPKEVLRGSMHVGTTTPCSHAPPPCLSGCVRLPDRERAKAHAFLPLSLMYVASSLGTASEQVPFQNACMGITPSILAFSLGGILESPFRCSTAQLTRDG